MKPIILLIFFTVFLTMGSLTLTEGGGSSQTFWRNPFYVSTQTQTNPTTLSIDYPVEGSTYYTNTHDINITIGPYDPTTYTCSYKVNTGTYNNCGSCTNPLCGSARTFVNGQNDLTVKAVGPNGFTTTETITFTIYQNVQAMGDLNLFILAPVALALTLVVFGDYKNEKRKK